MSYSGEADVRMMATPRGATFERVRVAPRDADAVSTAYDVLIGAGLLDGLPRLLREHLPAQRYAIITDSNVAQICGGSILDGLQRAEMLAQLLVFPAGEQNKTRASWAALTDRMLNAGYGRDAAVLALGGGVAGDLAGFVAATYMRGLPLVQLPTTLLAMIDSSVGGKTGVDTPAGKNLVGAFHQPRLVLADTETLLTLDHREIRSGLVEAVKHGAIADRGYYDWIAAASAALLGLGPDAMVRLIRRSVEIKAAVVGSDEREQGLRKTLNFGHTIGHAIEAASGFSLLHGEAIAIGLVIEATLGELLGVTEVGSAQRLEQLLRTLGLPVEIPAELPPADILELTRTDKKARAGQVEYALIESIGAASRGTGSYGTPIADDVVLAVLEAHRDTRPPHSTVP